MKNSAPMSIRQIGKSLCASLRAMSQEELEKVAYDLQKPHCIHCGKPVRRVRFHDEFYWEHMPEVRHHPYPHTKCEVGPGYASPVWEELLTKGDLELLREADIRVE